MTWLRLDADFPDHPVVSNLDGRAAWLYLCGLCYAAKHAGGAEIAYEDVLALTGHQDAYEHAQSLVDAGLWQRTETGYAFDFQQFASLVSKHRRPIRPELRRRVMERDGNKCIQCDATDDLTLDHIQPFSRGGSDNPSNLRVLCRSCNSRKGARR